MNYKSAITIKRFSFPATLTPDTIDGGYVVTFRDIPEAITQGDTEQEALIEATDCLEEAIAAKIDEKLDIPQPSQPKSGEQIVVVPIQTALKATLYLSMQESAMTKVELAKLIGVDEKEVRRILDPRHSTKLITIERALQALGKKIELQVV
jgi:antitoxin HicB